MSQIRKTATVPKQFCVACGACANVCRKGAISIYKGSFAQVETSLCVGCKLCENACPASIIYMEENRS